jgi:hypothetical protein
MVTSVAVAEGGLMPAGRVCVREADGAVQQALATRVHVLGSLFVLNALCLTSMNFKLKRKAQTGMVGLATSSFWAPLCEEAGSLLPGSHEGILRASAHFLAAAP